MKLFVQRGFDGTTLEDIAEKAGVARTTVYRRWSSKQALLAQAIAKGRGASEQEAAAGPTVHHQRNEKRRDAWRLEGAGNGTDFAQPAAAAAGAAIIIGLVMAGSGLYQKS